MRRIALAGIIGALLTLQACGSGAATNGATSSGDGNSKASDEMHTVTGQLAVYDGKAFPARRGKCAGGSPGYDDLAVGSQVTLKNQAGKIVGVGDFDAGRLDGLGGCVLKFSIPDARPADFYQLVSASLERAPRTISRADLAAANWHLELQVGDSEKAAAESGAYCLRPKDFRTEPLGATMGPMTGGRYGNPKGPVDGRVQVVSTSNKDADVRVYWEVSVWSPLYGGGFDMAALDYEWVTVPAGGTATLNFHQQNPDALIGGMDYDYNELRLTAKVHEAKEAGHRADDCA